jgi:hypothetical protein
MYGGAIAINNPILAGIDPEDGDPIEQLQESPWQRAWDLHPRFSLTLCASQRRIADFNEDARSITIVLRTTSPSTPMTPTGPRARACDGITSDPSDRAAGPGTTIMGKRLTFPS